MVRTSTPGYIVSEMAKAINRTMEIHESSYDGVKYTKSEEESAIEAIKECDLPFELWRVIQLALYWSNDLADWAKDPKAYSEEGVTAQEIGRFCYELGTKEELVCER